MFKIGDRVRLTTSGKTGIVRQVFDADYWNLSAGNGDHEYSVEFDNGEGAINLVERVLELVQGVKCECGALSVGSNKHSDYCVLYEAE